MLRNLIKLYNWLKACDINNINDNDNGGFVFFVTNFTNILKNIKVFEKNAVIYGV